MVNGFSSSHGNRRFITAFANSDLLDSILSHGNVVHNLISRYSDFILKLLSTHRNGYDLDSWRKGRSERQMFTNINRCIAGKTIHRAQLQLCLVRDS